MSGVEERCEETGAVPSRATTIRVRDERSMTENSPTPPVAQDDFPEFAEPPQQRPAHHDESERDASADARQAGVDEVLERLRRERDADR
jgi:hypothetical protein